MNKNSKEQLNTIRKYLLGSLDNEAKRRQVEERLLLEDDFNEEVEAAEDELIDQYLDKTLSKIEQERFLRFFLILPERREKLRLVRNLRKYAANETQIQNVKQFSQEKTSFQFDWRRIFSSVPLRLTVLVLMLGGFSYGVWRAAFYQSDVDRGLAQLQIAYRERRSVESRIVGLDYAPLNSNTRGADKNESVDTAALEQAESFLRYAAVKSANAASSRALGKFYLAKKNYDKAVEQFESAAALAPNDAQLQSDWGAALLEMGRKAAAEQNSAKSFELLNESQNHLEKAIALDPQLLEAKFNQALCFQALFSPEQAKQAWREYLELDADSRWAEEARRNLELLESKKPQERSAAELERDFLIALAEKKNEEAWLLLSQNRELIREKYLPQRLAMSFLKATGDEKKNLLDALRSAGELEQNHIGDSFAAEIARFYTSLPEGDAEDSLREAQNSVQNGYELCLKQDYPAALSEFKKARDLFSGVGDIWEAKLSEYLTGYCLLNTEHVSESLTELRRVVEFSQTGKYKWLEVTALYWLASSLSKSHQTTASKRTQENALSLAQEIKDSYAVQRNLLELATYNSLVGQKQAALDYLQPILEKSNLPETSSRQKYRNYDDVLRILTAAKLYHAAKTIAVESAMLADRLGDQTFQVLSYNNVAVAYVKTGNFAGAQAWTNAGREKAEMIADGLSRKRMLAYCFLKSGYLQSQASDYEKSEQFYDEAARLYETIENPFNLYEAQKGKLLAYQALGKSAQLEQQIPLMLHLAEDYRGKILEERERTSFFEAEESLYDVAVNFEFGTGRYERAYDFAENASSRSLLDWLQSGEKASGDQKRMEFSLEESVKPLTLAEIRSEMPDGVQILQYSVLDDKVLIWLVSKEKFVVVSSKIQSGELREKVENYVSLIKQRDGNGQAAARRLSQELYNLLISPIRKELNSSQEICLIPNKFLFYLPFAALVSPETEPFLAHYSIFYSPSANVFLFCTKQADEKSRSSAETLLSVGNPAFDRQNFDDLSYLPAAEKEAREITGFYNQWQMLFGREATKRALLNSIKNADVIHFAGHYVVVDNAPLSSFLLLAKDGKRTEDGILTNSELIGEKLPKAKLVVLSACQTGVEQYYDGEGLIGLSRTFLAAGVPLVVASQWSVDTDATAQLMKRFHFFRREKMTSRAALRSAQLEMLNEPNGHFREPYFWAAFTALGGFATF